MHFAHGPSLKKARELKKEKALHHLRIRPGVNHSWAVSHHTSESSDPVEVHNFADGKSMLAHIGESVDVDGENGEGSHQDRENG
jgi:hypothetical protein